MTIENNQGSARGEILVVEDNVSNLKYLSVILQHAGYVVRAANNGELALRSITEKLPDIVLLDIQMTGMDGIEVCKRLKQNPTTSELPIIFLSAQEDTDTKVRALEAGGADYVTKPFQSFEILARIKTHVSMARNIAARKYSEQALWVISNRQQAMLSAIPDIIVEVDKNKVYTWANSAGLEFYGEDVVGKEAAFYFEGEQDTYRNVAPLFGGSENVIYVESWQRRKDGQKRLLAWWCRMLKDSSGNVTGAISTARDITERKLADEALQEIVQQLAKAQEIAHLGSWELDLSTGQLAWSDETYRIFGFEPRECEATYETFLSAVHPEDRAHVDETYSASIKDRLDSYQIEHRIVRQRTGEVRFVQEKCEHIRDASGKPIRSLGMIQDITDRKKAEEEHLKYEQQLQQSQKLESLGLLAGGIAHDFNNLLGGIYGYIDLAGEGAMDEQHSRHLSKAMATIERARGLTLQLLTFAKGGAPIKKIGNLFPFVQETTLFALSGSNVSCTFAIQPDLCPCDFDKNQIGQVIDNIVINAKQAMADGGTIAVSARNSTVRENEHPPLTSGAYVVISIKDSGIGIPKNILPKIFDPFYTTKATGHGLGLATCFSIVNRHGGCIEVESEPGEGSTFHVFLPASCDAISSSSDAETAIHTGTGTFLVMDDQEVMRDTIGDMLDALGYTAVCTDTGKDAIVFVTSAIKAGRKIAGMIFDLTIPGGMGGKEAIAEIRKMDACAETPVFVTSGYSKDPIMANPVKHGFTASICKPFRKSELSKMLNSYMSQKN